ncbi:SDR family NAD(P)-dependent oxidoreductase [Streptomyces sp. ODS28]|uniref:SDR family NAD(P)-dependent oxidoreductase n=1 Tax=Streptomyces sp. ODS28 TaxID=3136688 RepID=UPI0031F17FFC
MTQELEPQIPELPSLAGRVAVVTGAGGVVGRGIARRMAVAGAAVVVHYRTSGEAAREVVAQIQRDGGQAVAVRADLLEPEECAALMRTAVDAYGRLDTLVNNAGVQPVSGMREMTSEEWRTVVDTNATGTFTATQAAAAVMRERGGGSVTHIGSIEGSQTQYAHSHYCSAKAAVLMHARTAALELAPDGIRVNSVSPGLIGHPTLETDWPEGVERWRAAAPLGRLGTPEDVGDACVFLASPMASWITGQDLRVDGGVSVHPTW